MSGFTTDLLQGFAELLAGASIGLTWQASGAYAAGQTGIFIGAVPQTPDRLVALTDYLLGDDPTYSDSACGLQVRTRGATADPREVGDLDDAIFGALAGLWPMSLPTGIRVVTLQRTSGVPLGKDDLQRQSRSSNYTLSLHRPALHRL